MSRMSIMLVSLLPAIAGGILAYLCVMAFLNQGGGQMFQVAGGAGVLLGLMGIITPIMGFVFTAPAVSAAPSRKPTKPLSDDEVESMAESGEFESVEDENLEAVDSNDDLEEVTSEYDDDEVAAGSFDEDTGDTESFDADHESEAELDEFSLSEAELSTSSGSSLNLEEDEVVEEMDEIIIPEDDDEPPAKKKKRK